MTQTQPVIYEWSGDYFCGGCIVSTITSYEPFSQYVEAGHDVHEHPPAASLVLIRAWLQARNLAPEYPRRLRRPPEGVHVCSTCLNFFTMLPTSEEKT